MTENPYPLLDLVTIHDANSYVAVHASWPNYFSYTSDVAKPLFDTGGHTESA